VALGSCLGGGERAMDGWSLAGFSLATYI